MELNGHTYKKRDGLTTILVMGVDHETQESYAYRQAGQADFLRLIVLDSNNKTVQQLQIDRDTITPVTVLGVMGDRYEPVEQQICVGYGFGDGRQTSCEVTVEAVENLLGGQTVDQYLSMGLDGISTLNDLAGGITVTLEDDFSAIDPAMTKGTTLTLHGDQAETFVRTRRSIGVGTNEARMARQEQYIQKLATQLDAEVKQNQNFVLTAYDAMEPYLYTNIPRASWQMKCGRQRIMSGWIQSSRKAPMRSVPMALWSSIRMLQACSRLYCSFSMNRLNKCVCCTFR